MQNAALWNAIERYEIGGRCQGYLFRDHLTSRGKIDSSHHDAAIQEYKRFIYLTQISERRVVPSNIVNHIWQIHLQMTRDYWDGLCASVLGRPLHHDMVSRHDSQDQNEAQFRRTLALYEKEFGVTPYWRFWGDSDMDQINARLLAHSKANRENLAKTWARAKACIYAMLCAAVSILLFSNGEIFAGLLLISVTCAHFYTAFSKNPIL